MSVEYYKQRDESALRCREASDNVLDITRRLAELDLPLLSGYQPTAMYYCTRDTLREELKEARLSADKLRSAFEMYYRCILVGSVMVPVA